MGLVEIVSEPIPNEQREGQGGDLARIGGGTG